MKKYVLYENNNLISFKESEHIPDIGDFPIVSWDSRDKYRIEQISNNELRKLIISRKKLFMNFRYEEDNG